MNALVMTSPYGSQVLLTQYRKLSSNSDTLYFGVLDLPDLQIAIEEEMALDGQLRRTYAPGDGAVGCIRHDSPSHVVIFKESNQEG